MKIASSDNVLFVDFRRDADDDWIVATPLNERAAADRLDDRIESARMLALEIAAENRDLERLLFSGPDLRLVEKH